MSLRVAGGETERHLGLLIDQWLKATSLMRTIPAVLYSYRNEYKNFEVCKDTYYLWEDEAQP